MGLVSACFCQQAIESFQYLLCLASGVSGGIADDLPGGINSSRMDCDLTHPGAGSEVFNRHDILQLNADGFG